MGIRSSATAKLELAMAAGFQAYLVGDPSFVRPGPTQASLFVAAQSVSQLIYPQVAFLCDEAEEQVSGSAVYMGTLHVQIDSALNEREDDYPSLKALHDDRVAKVLDLFSKVSILQGLVNAPASGADKRAVRDFQLYGVGQITKEMHAKEANRLCTVITISIPFQPI
jgi:hypothetical protein